MDDLRAVLDAISSERAALLGAFEGGQLAAMFAASYPERTAGLVLYNASARNTSSPDYPWGPSEDELQSQVRAISQRWGTREFAAEHLRSIDPGLAGDPEFREWWLRFTRLSMSPGAATAFHRMMIGTDIRPILPAIRVPTLVLSRAGYAEHGRYLADHIPGARYAAFSGRGLVHSVPPELFDEIEQFLGGLGAQPSPERVLATVLFTDIVDSTSRAAELGDAAWRELVQRHHSVVRGLLARHRGEELDTAGDGFFASFDGPGRAIACASAIRDELPQLGLEVRAGLHTGECERLEGKLGGIAVVIGARVAAEAAAGEVLVTSTVKDLVAGSEHVFEDRGQRELKGVPGSWQLFSVVARGPGPAS